MGSSLLGRLARLAIRSKRESLLPSTLHQSCLLQARPRLPLEPGLGLGLVTAKVLLSARQGPTHHSLDLIDKIAKMHAIPHQVCPTWAWP